MTADLTGMTMAENGGTSDSTCVSVPSGDWTATNPIR